MAETALTSSAVASSDDIVAAHPNTIRADLINHTHGGSVTPIIAADTIKTLTGARTLTLPTGQDDTVVTLGATQTLTAKTLTNPTLTSPSMTTPQIVDSGSNHSYVFVPSDLAANRNVTLPLLPTADEFTFNAMAQTLTNKTLTSPVLTTPQINDTTADHQYVFAVSELTADRTVTLPLLTTADEFVFKDHAVTLTNKTLTAPAMSTPQILDSSATHGYIFAVNELSADRTVTLPLLTGADEFVFKDFIQTLTNKTLTAPTIADFTNANHDHGDADDGGALASGITLTDPVLGGSRSTVASERTSDTALAAITGLSLTLTAAGVYVVRMGLRIAASTGGVKFDLNGGTCTATALTAYCHMTNYADDALKTVDNLTDLTSVASYNDTISGMAIIEGLIVVNGGGTLIPRFAQQISSGVVSAVNSGSWFTAHRIS